MIAMRSHARDLTGRLNDCRRQQDDLRARFAQDFDKKSDLVTSLLDLGFSLSEDQVAQMEENRGFPVAHLTAGQQPLLSQAEPLAREIQFLAHIKDQTLAESTLQ